MSLYITIQQKLSDYH